MRWSSDLCCLCRFVCCLWFIQPIVALVTADQAQDSRQDRLIRSLYSNSFSCVCASLVHNIESGVHQQCALAPDSFCHGRGLVAGKNCWHRHEWSVIRTHFQIWILSIMSLFLPSYLNFSYLHLRRWHQRLHLFGSRCGMMWDRNPSNHTFSLLSEAQRFSQFGHIAQMLDETYAKKILITIPLGELEEITYSRWIFQLLVIN